MKKLIITLMLASLGVLWAQGPEIDVDVLNAKKTFQKAKTNKIVVSDFTVIFATYNSQAKNVHSGSNVSVNVWLKNYNQNMMQTVTDAIYRKFLDDLQANGFELVSAEELKGTKQGKKFNLMQGGGEPVSIEVKNKKQGINMEYLLFTPNDLTYISDGRKEDGTNNVGIKTSMKLSQAYETLNVMSFSSSYKMDFIDFTSKGGYFSKSASVSARPALNGADMNNITLLFVHKYVPGTIRVFLNKRYASPLDLTGDMVEIKSNKFFGSAFANYEFTPDNYEEAANQYLNTVETALLTRIVDEWKNAGSKGNKKKSKRRRK